MPRPLTKRKGQAKRKASESTPRPSKKATTPKSMPQPVPSVGNNASGEAIVISVDDASDDVNLLLNQQPTSPIPSSPFHVIFYSTKIPFLKIPTSLHLVNSEFDILGIRKLVKYAENYQSYMPEGLRIIQYI